MKLYGAQGVSPQVLLAYALSHGYQLSPPPALARTPLGKPYFPQYPHLHINWSHSGSLVLWRCLTPLWGVDVEWVRPRAATLPPVCSDPRGIRRLPASGGEIGPLSTVYGPKRKPGANTQGRASAATGAPPLRRQVCFFRPMPAAAGGPACAGRNPLPTKLFGWRTSHHETDTSLLSPRHPPGCPGTAGKVFGPVPGRPSPGGANPGNRGLHWTDGQSLSRLQLPANPPDGDLIRPHRAPPISISFMVCITA